MACQKVHKQGKIKVMVSIQSFIHPNIFSQRSKDVGMGLCIHCKEEIVIMTDSLLFQIQMSEHNSLPCGGELHDNLFLILSQLSSTLSYHLGN